MPKSDAIDFYKDKIAQLKKEVFPSDPLHFDRCFVNGLIYTPVVLHYMVGMRSQNLTVMSQTSAYVQHYKCLIAKQLISMSFLGKRVLVRQGT